MSASASSGPALAQGEPIQGEPAHGGPARAAPLPAQLQFFHSLGSIAYGIKDNGFSVFLLIYYNQVLGMSAQLVSLALMLALVVDACIDPLVGHLSDNTVTRWGRRLPWLYLAPIPLGIAWILLWTPPLTGAPSFWYLVALAVGVRALLSACEVPSVSLVPELTRDYDERTTLMRLRFLFGWGGGLIVLFLAYDVFLVPDATHANGQLNPAGYWNYGLFGGIVITLSVLISALGQHRWIAKPSPPRVDRTGKASAFADIVESLSHPAFVIVAVAAAMAYISQGITFSITNYLFLYVWRFTAGAFSIYPFMLFGSVVCAFFLVAPLHHRMGKKLSAVVCALSGMIFWVAPFVLLLLRLWPTAGTPFSTGLLFAFVFVGNVLGVIVMISASSMVADVVEASQEKTGRRSEATFFAGNFFVQKCATGLGIFLTGQIVGLSGLPAKALPGAVDVAVLDRLTLFYCVLVVVLAIAAAAIFRRFPISRADHERRLQLLDETAWTERDGTGITR